MFEKPWRVLFVARLSLNCALAFGVALAQVVRVAVSALLHSDDVVDVVDELLVVTIELLLPEGHVCIAQAHRDGEDVVVEDFDAEGVHDSVHEVVDSALTELVFGKDIVENGFAAVFELLLPFQAFPAEALGNVGIMRMEQGFVGD